jgi:hypothetical protein
MPEDQLTVPEEDDRPVELDELELDVDVVVAAAATADVEPGMVTALT